MEMIKILARSWW